jgi:hypothetical protein
MKRVAIGEFRAQSFKFQVASNEPVTWNLEPETDYILKRVKRQRNAFIAGIGNLRFCPPYARIFPVNPINRAKVDRTAGSPSQPSQGCAISSSSNRGLNN